ncbi:MAG: DUF72 domain-containing protein [Acidobacteria bacterium]|nr:MAG: DUF72 domain-containing protein [Acidobacteriota bacterium]
MAQLYAGTSGFAYASWKPDFYPAKLPAKDFLKHYATRLNAVEINYTFRHLPSASTLENWVNATSAGFVFGCKAHMRITHLLRLKEHEFTQVFFRAIDPLRASRRLGPVLFQLPPNFKAEIDVLAAFLEKLATDIRYAFEFRNDSWLTDEVYRLLEKHGVALCLAESEQFVVPEVITAGFVYVRLRKEDYSAEERKEISARAKRLLADGRDAYVFFKHEETPAGALYAEELVQAFPAANSHG